MKQEFYVKLSIAVIIIAAIIRFALALSHTVSGDACWHLASSRFIATHDKIPLFEGLGRLQPFWPPPAFHFFAAFVYKILSLTSLGIAEVGMKLVSPVFGTLTVIVAYAITRKLFSERTTFYSMVFLNFTPLFIDYSVFSYTDSTATFFSILSIFFILNKRHVLSSISFGIAMLSKYNAIFVLPMLIYLTYKNSKNKKESFVNAFIVTFISLLISSVWFIRNLVLLGNPFWPYLNGIFKGVNIGTYFNTISFKFVFELGTYLKSYLELFGVPNGNISLIFFHNIPFIGYLLFIWFISTLIFIYPFVRGFFYREGKENKSFLKSVYILFLSHLLMLFVYLINTGWFGARLLLPIVPFMAIIWAKGLSSLKIKKIYLLTILVISIGFVVVEAIKISIAANEWSIYQKDFGWVRNNSSKNDLFYGNGQCLSYNINRLVVDQLAELELDNVDYIWVNNKWRIDFTMNDESLGKIKNSDRLKVIYSNTNSGTTIYKVK